jgi:hypothetical protein
MGFWWARQAFLESLHKPMTVDHCPKSFAHFPLSSAFHFFGPQRSIFTLSEEISPLRGARDK